MDSNVVDYSTKIPNNVGLTEDRQVLRALEGLASGLSQLVARHGAGGLPGSVVYLRTA